MRLASIRSLDGKAYAKQLADAGKIKNTVRLGIAPVRVLLADPAAGLRLGRVEEDVPDPTGALGHLTAGGEPTLRAVGEAE